MEKGERDRHTPPPANVVVVLARRWASLLASVERDARGDAAPVGEQPV